MHFYPGHFGWGKPETVVHKNWLECLPDGKGVCEWRDRLNRLNAAFFVGEFQPWADMETELAGQITRASFDAYTKLGWAATAWSYKLTTATGGHGPVNWGMVTNATGEVVPALDFATASLQEIKNLFVRFGTVPYTPHPSILKWMNSPQPPAPFGGATH
jgi:glucan 1,3-beta-glucosidase